MSEQEATKNGSQSEDPKDPKDPEDKWMVDWRAKQEARHKKADVLLQNIKDNMDALKELQSKVSAHWGFEDGFYRYYHHLFKVYRVQALTQH